MGDNWWQTFWYAPEKAIYGLHGGSRHLFRFDPRAPKGAEGGGEFELTHYQAARHDSLRVRPRHYGLFWK